MASRTPPEQLAASELAKKREKSLQIIAKRVASLEAAFKSYNATRRPNANPYGSRYR